jgi:hypothetical protein
MIGIPFTILRESERGVEEETIFLRSRRRGPEGEKMRQAIREHNRALLEQSRQAVDAATAVGKLRAGDLSQADLEQVRNAQGAAFEAAQNAGRKALEMAEAVAEAALAENYEAAAREKILDKLTDSELIAIVNTIELGAMPKDFFLSLDTLRNQSSIRRSGAGSAPPSSPQAIPEATSKTE